ncbi:MAG: polysaccharide deacetylase family protein [Pseudomonadota bacterium]
MLKLNVLLTAVFAMLLTGCMSAPHAVTTEATSSPHTEFMLTFDDGPLPDMTERVLDMLATLKVDDGTAVKAGFFLVADAPDTFWRRRQSFAAYELWTKKGSMAKYPELVRRIYQEGHVIGNHTTHHAWFRWPWKNSPDAITAEFTDWQTIARSILPETPTRLFRPPYFVLTKNVRAVAADLGYQIVMGEAAGDATPFMTVEMIKKHTEALLTEWDEPYPCVLVFHEMRPATNEHLTEIVTNLQQKGFTLVHFDPARLGAAN